MWQRLLTLSIWALVGASAVGYGLRLVPGTPPSAAPLAATGGGDVSLDPTAAARLLGAPAKAEAPVVTDTRYQLLGVAAARSPELQQQQGVALIAVEGAPPRAVRVGQWVDGQTQLLAVNARGADLGRDGVTRLQLQLQPLAPAATGSLPPAMVPMPAPAPGPAQVPITDGAVSPQVMAPNAPLVPGAPQPLAIPMPPTENGPQRTPRPGPESAR